MENVNGLLGTPVLVVTRTQSLSGSHVEGLKGVQVKVNKGKNIRYLC